MGTVYQLLAITYLFINISWYKQLAQGEKCPLTKVMYFFDCCLVHHWYWTKQHSKAEFNLEVSTSANYLMSINGSFQITAIVSFILQLAHYNNTYNFTCI